MIISSTKAFASHLFQHYKKSLASSFDRHPDANYLVILEEDLYMSVDILSFFKQLLPVLENDESVYCLSAWNDQVIPVLYFIDCVYLCTIIWGLKIRRGRKQRRLRSEFAFFSIFIAIIQNHLLCPMQANCLAFNSNIPNGLFRNYLQCACNHSKQCRNNVMLSMG